MKNKTYIYHLLFPALIYAIFTGVSVGCAIVFFKFCASHIIRLSTAVYDQLRTHPAYIPAAIGILFLCACLYAAVYHFHSNLRGGGIPTSIGILRGLIPFRWIYNFCGVFAMSQLTFFLGVPLGTEGPSVQIGTALGRGVTRFGSRTTGKKHAAWDRYLMTAGACAGFCTATDAPISGMMFAIEEAHQRISPMIILVSTISVTAAKVTSAWLSPLFGINTYLFAPMHLITLKPQELWLPILIALAVGLFAVLFLKYYLFLRTLWQKSTAYLNRILPIRVRGIFGAVLPLFAVLLLTLISGLVSETNLSSGHHLIEQLMHGHLAWFLLFALVAVRMTVMIFANSAGITGGMFLPIMALGAMISSIIGGFLITHTPLTAGYYPVVVVLGITACIAGMMKMPLTAIVFAIEALSAHQNIVPVLLVSVLAYFITELFDAEAINETVLEHRLEDLRRGKEPITVDTTVSVEAGSFAIGKQVRDIFWPANLFVLSVKHPSDSKAEMDERGDKTLRAGDLLHVRYETYNPQETAAELAAITGTQKPEESNKI
ncbi:MAG: hypothetical protein E7604_08625 [Ruminococcaceae bacterium]|nr:hypothetical protein [Oscillospiraceae bacterium]